MYKQTTGQYLYAASSKFYFMTTIIVPTDFSENSVNAAIYAARLAEQLDMHITLLHALPLPLSAGEPVFPASNYEDDFQQTDRLMKQLKVKLEGNSNTTVSYRIIMDSFLAEIERLNHRQDIFAMVMGMSGSSGAEAFIFGSFSLMAATHFKHPLLVIPPDCTFNGFQKVGLACDMLNISETLPSKSILGFLEHFDAPLHILHIVKPEIQETAQIAVASRSIQNMLQSLRPEIHATQFPTVKEGLEEFVQLNNIDLLMVIPKERTFVERVFHKSLTKKMVLHSRVPVVILHKE